MLLQWIKVFSKFWPKISIMNSVISVSVETSMIHSIYVKSYLFPDKRKQTKRKTEEIKLENKTDVENKKSIKSGNAIFKPSSFTFSKSLDYKDISSVMATRDVFLSVCVTQKYTHRSFTIATWSLPLKNAIKKMVKEKYTLAPCISSSIPDNMKVYNATELDIVRKKAFGSNPSLVCRRTAIGNWAVPYEGRSASDSDLNRVRVDKGVEKVPSIEITVPEVEDEELQDALEQISIMERREAAAECRSLSTTVDLDMSLDSSRISLPGVSDCDGEESYLEEVRVEPNVHLAQVEVHLPNLQKSRADDPQHSKSCRNVSPGSHWVGQVNERRLGGDNCHSTSSCCTWLRSVQFISTSNSFMGLLFRITEAGYKSCEFWDWGQ